MKKISRKLMLVLIVICVVSGMLLLMPGALFAAPGDLNLTSNVWGDTTQRNWRVTNSTGSDIDVTWVVVSTSETGVHVATPGASFFQTTSDGGSNTVIISWDAGASTKTKASCNTTFTGTITATAGPGGAISPDGVFKNWELHAYYPTLPMTTTFTITPNPGYAILDVLVNGASVGAVGSYDFIENGAVTGNANQTIEALFSALPVVAYTITASTDDRGIITDEGTTSVSQGSSKTYSMDTVSTDCSIVRVLVDGVSIGKVKSYTFTDVIANHTIHVIIRCKAPVTTTEEVGVLGITEEVEVLGITEELPFTGQSMIFYIIGALMLALAGGLTFVLRAVKSKE